MPFFGKDRRRATLTQALERFEGPLLRYAARILKDEERARDVVQEAFLKLWKAEPQPEDGVLGPWLYAVCRNQALDVLRKDRRMVISDNVPEPEALPVAAQDESPGLSAVLAALSTLPPQHQEVIRLKFQSGFSYKDISRVTGLSEGNVGFIIHTSIKKLRGAVAAGGRP